MRRLPALVATLLLPATPPLLLGTAAFTGALLVSQAPARAQSAEAVAKVAQAITVRIEGATQGSGVLVKRDGNRYTVLTAWHVVSGQRAGEELDVYTPDGQRHSVEPGSIKRLGQLDMAVLSFVSSDSYELARVGDVSSVKSGEQLIVAGFPNLASARLKTEKGRLVANASVGIDQGYQLLYTNETVSGMSGGVILSSTGALIGTHGRGELDREKSNRSGVSIKTGTNQGVPISYFRLYEAGQPVVAATTQALTTDDFLAQAKALIGKKGREQEVISLTGLALKNGANAEAYFYRAYAKNYLGDNQGAIDEYSQVIAINPQDTNAFVNRGLVKAELGDNQGAIADCNQAIAINPQLAEAYIIRGNVKSELGDKQGAIADYNQAIAINPQNAAYYSNRGNVKSELGDKQGAIADYNQSIAINPQLAGAFYNRGNVKLELGDQQGAISDYNQAIAINPQNAAYYSNRGSAKAVLGDKQGATADYNQAIAVNPQNADYYSNRGNVKFELGDKEGAIADYNQAIAINPRFYPSYYNRGNAKYYLGDKQGACSDYKKAASLGSRSTAKWLQSDAGAWCRNMP